VTRDRRRIEQPDRVVARLGSPSLAELDAQCASANARRVLDEHRKRTALRERNRRAQTAIRARWCARVRGWFSI
jgi:hypothetical protein